MEEREKKPKIRFRGFSGDWEEKMLGEISTINGGKDYKHLKIGDIPVYGTGGYMLSVNEALSYYEDAIGIGRKGTIDKPYILKSPFWTVDTLFYVIPYNNSDLDFMFCVFQNIDWSKKDESTGVPSLSKISINNTFVATTDIIEQQKIGALFSNIDNLITQQQKKYDKLVNIKKSMLEKMFPQNDSKYPEVRFEGFSDEWEEEKITSVAKIYIGLVTTMTKNYTDKGTLLIRNSDIKNNYFEFSNKPIYLEKAFAEQNSSRMHEIGDVITVHTGDVGTSAVITEKEDKSIGFATIVTRPNKNILKSEYLSIFLNSDKHKNFAVNQSTGDGRLNYNLKEYNELKIPLCTIEEQQKIGEYFQNLDKLINEQQKQLEKLKTIKKSLLENMFV